MKIYITGDSHTAALKLGLDELMLTNEMHPAHSVEVAMLAGANSFSSPYFKDMGEFAEFRTRKSSKRIRRLPFSDEDGHYDYYGICEPLHASRLWRFRSNWVNHHPFTRKDGLAPVSESLLRHVILREQAYNLQLVELLKRVHAKVFVIEAPKPYRHRESVQQTGFGEVSYIDNFYKNIIRGRLQENDIPFINVPSVCYDAEGFMYDEFKSERQGDSLHANKSFGKIMIKEIIRLLDS